MYPMRVPAWGIFHLLGIFQKAFPKENQIAFQQRSESVGKSQVGLMENKGLFG